MKKLLAVLLIIILLVTSLAACAIKPEPDTDGQTADTAPTDEPKTEEAEDVEEDIDIEEIDEKLRRYRSALRFLNSGKIKEAYDILLTIKDYRNVNEYLERFSFKCDTETYSYKRYSETRYYEYDKYGKTTLERIFSTCSQTEDSFVFEYDDNQNLLSRVHYRDGEVQDFVYYTYDESNNPKSQTRSEFGTVNYEYDAHGNMIKTVTNDADATEYTYDDEGRLLSEMSRDSAHVYEYDTDGNCTKIVYTYHIGSPYESLHVITQQYDEKGNLIRKQTVQANGYTYYSEYEYDENGNQIKDATYYPQSNYVIFSWKYDKNGNVAEHHREDEEGQDYSYFYEYDEKGNRIKETYISYTGNITGVTTYEYDDYGNLTKKVWPGETDSPDDYYVATYTGYELYYNPYGTQILPPEYWTKG